MKFRLATFILLIVSGFLSHSVLSQRDNNSVFNSGPKNKAKEGFVSLYIMRSTGSLDPDLWYSVMYENISLGSIKNNSKYLFRFPLDGKKRFWSQHDPSSPSSGIWVDLQYGKSYYIQLQLHAGAKHPNPELVLMDSVKGKAEYDNIDNPVNFINYPVPPDIPEAVLVGRPFDRKILQPIYYHASDSFRYWKYTFRLPSFFQYMYLSGKNVYYFLYKNNLLSATYSEYLKLYGKEIKAITTEDDLLDYLKKDIKDGKLITGKKEKLVTLNYEPTKSFGDFGWLALSEIEDHDAVNTGNNQFLLMRDVRAYVYKNTEDKPKAVMILLLSCRGTPEEIYSFDEMKEKLKQFMSTWEYVSQ